MLTDYMEAMVFLTFVMICHYQVRMALYSKYTDTLICYYTTVLPKLSIVDLLEQLKWHQKQLQAGNRCTTMVY